jgi:hypothetical protein
MFDHLPNYLLRAEGAAVAVAATSVYFYADSAGALLLVVAVAPDLGLR